MSKPPFLLQSKIEDAILDFFRDLRDHNRHEINYVNINESTVEFDGILDAYKLTLAIERAVDEALAEEAS